MSTDAQRAAKQVYSSPEIVDFGSIVASTTGTNSPVRDNTASTEYNYYDSSSTGRIASNGHDEEVDLGDR